MGQPCRRAWLQRAAAAQARAICRAGMSETGKVRRTAGDLLRPWAPCPHSSPCPLHAPRASAPPCRPTLTHAVPHHLQLPQARAPQLARVVPRTLACTPAHHLPGRTHSMRSSEKEYNTQACPLTHLVSQGVPHHRPQAGLVGPRDGAAVQHGVHAAEGGVGHLLHKEAAGAGGAAPTPHASVGAIHGSWLHG